MIRGHDIICFSNDWNSDPLSKKHIMVRLARNNRVLWINSIGLRSPAATASDFRRVFDKLAAFIKGCKRVEASIYVFSPLAIPFHSTPLARWMNRRILKWSVRYACWRLGFHNPITWTFVPSSADVAGSLGEQSVFYHCVDEYSEFSGMHKASLLAMEQRLIEKSDCVMVSSGPLYETKRLLNPNTHLVTHGVDVDHFRKACDDRTPVPEDIRPISKPIIGFFGLIAEWVDLDLIRFIAKARPSWNVVLIGKSTVDLAELKRHANIHVMGQRPYDLLPNYAKAFDLAILPFIVNELTRAANPLKLREYLAAGLPVVATNIPEAERLDLVRIGHNNEDFVDRIQQIVDSGECGPHMQISLRMDAESWDAKVEQMCEIVETRARLQMSVPRGILKLDESCTSNPKSEI